MLSLKAYGIQSYELLIAPPEQLHGNEGRGRSAGVNRITFEMQIVIYDILRI